MSDSQLFGLISAAAVVVLLVLAVVLHKWLLRLFGVVLVPENTLAEVNKKFVLFGSNKTLPDGAVIALNGEAGWQADTLAPGVYFGLWPWQYEIKLVPFVVISDGALGIVDAIDGASLPKGRVLGTGVESNRFQDARAFLKNGGQRGPQLAVLTPGTYRINTQLFNVRKGEATVVQVDKVGIVTVSDGRQLDSSGGEIAGPAVPGHTSFQDADAFVAAGGAKGLQEQVLLAGRYFINPLFAKVQPVDMTVVPIAHVGVVISYVGKHGEDVSGESFKHGNLVGQGERGVWAEPLDPGKYPINTHTHRVELVPTANVVLNWADAKSESHELDENLSTITARSSDGFTFNLDVSQIIHIPRQQAAMVIARFGNMLNLVTQVLEPVIGNYFRNSAQSNDVIDFLQERQKRQLEARTAIASALGTYNVEAVDTLIGDIVPPQDLMKTLTDRKLAQQSAVTFENQRLAEENRQKLEQAKAQATTQAQVVASERKVQIAEFEANAAVKTAEGDARRKTITAAADAEMKTINARADAEVQRVNGDAAAHVVDVSGKAEAAAKLAIGTAEADVIKLKIESMEAGNYASVEVARALSASGHRLTPDIVAGGAGTSMLDVLVAGMLATGKSPQLPSQAGASSPATDATVLKVKES